MRRKHFQAGFSIQDGIEVRTWKSFIVVLYTLKKKMIHNVRKKARRYPAGVQINPSNAPSGKEPSTLVDVFAERIAILEAEVLNGKSQFRYDDRCTHGSPARHQHRKTLFRRTKTGTIFG